MRARKPWVRARLKLWGWYVRFMAMFPGVLQAVNRGGRVLYRSSRCGPSRTSACEQGAGSIPADLPPVNAAAQSDPPPARDVPHASRRHLCCPPSSLVPSSSMSPSSIPGPGRLSRHPVTRPAGQGLLRGACSVPLGFPLRSPHPPRPDFQRGPRVGSASRLPASTARKVAWLGGSSDHPCPQLKIMRPTRLLSRAPGLRGRSISREPRASPTAFPESFHTLALSALDPLVPLTSPK